MSQAQQASIAEKPRQYSLQELPFTNVKSIGSRGSVLMLAVRFEEVVSRGAGAAVALFSGAVIREMYRTKILSVKVCLPRHFPCTHLLLPNMSLYTSQVTLVERRQANKLLHSYLQQELWPVRQRNSMLIAAHFCSTPLIFVHTTMVLVCEDWWSQMTHSCSTQFTLHCVTSCQTASQRLKH